MVDAHFLTFEHLPHPNDGDLDEGVRLGHALMIKIAHQLQDFEKVADPVDQWEAYGWYIVVQEGPANVYCMLQWSDPWLLMCWAHRTLGDKLRGRRYEAELAGARNRVAKAVGIVTGIQNPQWSDEPQWAQA